MSISSNVTGGQPDGSISRVKGTLARKLASSLLQLYRLSVLLESKKRDFLERPPILVNSVPKSGTHLLLQMVRALTDRRFFGSFIASTPSLTMNERSALSYRQAVGRIVPAEVVPGHLYYSRELEDQLHGKNVVHFLILRDPRDVVVSEAMYLTYMTQFHRLHRAFRSLDSDDERISVAINGLEDAPCGVEYPDVAERYACYEGWRRSNDVAVIRFEELRSPDPWNPLARLIRLYNARASIPLAIEDEIPRMLAGINPARSHTFRKGMVGGWRKAFTVRHIEEMKAVAGDLLIQLGYETDLDW